MYKELFFKLLPSIRDQIEAEKNNDDNAYTKASKKLMNIDGIDMMTFGYLIQSNNLENNSDDDLYNYFVIWKDGFERGIYAAAHSMDSLIYDLKLPEKIHAQCLNSAMKDKHLAGLTIETKKLYGHLAYLYGFEGNANKIESGLKITMKDLENLSDYHGERLELMINELKNKGLIEIKKSKNKLNSKIIFVKFSDDFFDLMEEYDEYFHGYDKIPFLILTEWQSDEQKEKMIKNFNDIHGFEPNIWEFKMPDEMNEIKEQIKNQ